MASLLRDKAGMLVGGLLGLQESRLLGRNHERVAGGHLHLSKRVGNALLLEVSSVRANGRQPLCYEQQVFDIPVCLGVKHRRLLLFDRGEEVNNIFVGGGIGRRRG